MTKLSDKSPQFRHLLGKAFRFLALRPRSSAEVKARLLTYSPTGPELVAEVFAYLLAEHLVDDAEFLAWWLRVRGEKRSRAVLIYELMGKGLTREFILSHFPKNEFSELNALQNLILKKTKGNIPTDVLARQKLFRYLLSKGFSLESIKAALRKD